MHKIIKYAKWKSNLLDPQKILTLLKIMSEFCGGRCWLDSEDDNFDRIPTIKTVWISSFFFLCSFLSSFLFFYYFGWRWGQFWQMIYKISISTFNIFIWSKTIVEIWSGQIATSMYFLLGSVQILSHMSCVEFRTVFAW